MMLWVSDQYAKEKLEDVGERENANSINSTCKIKLASKVLLNEI